MSSTSPTFLSQPARASARSSRARCGHGISSGGAASYSRLSVHGPTCGLVSEVPYIFSVSSLTFTGICQKPPRSRIPSLVGLDNRLHPRLNGTTRDQSRPHFVLATRTGTSGITTTGMKGSALPIRRLVLLRGSLARRVQTYTSNAALFFPKGHGARSRSMSLQTFLGPLPTQSTWPGRTVSTSPPAT
jgi:hypothetical protein